MDNIITPQSLAKETAHSTISSNYSWETQSLKYEGDSRFSAALACTTSTSTTTGPDYNGDSDTANDAD